jgi:uncharacterized protein
VAQIAIDDRFPDSASEGFPLVRYLVVKLASRCNINCTYCYWFRDAEVYNKPPLLTLEAESALCERLKSHIERFGLSEFALFFHGGEPLLFPKSRFRDLMDRIRDIQARTGCRIDCDVTTNAMLVDHEWANLLATYDVRPAISLDGPAHIHDGRRIDFKGLGTHAATLRGLAALRKVGIEPGAIAVSSPSGNPEELLAYLVDDLGLKRLDILPPQATHDDHPPPIAEYYIRLFDIWYGKYAKSGVRVRTIDAFLRGLLGYQSMSNVIGLGRVATVTVMTDGGLEPEDVIRIIGDGSTKTTTTLFENVLQDMEDDLLWRQFYEQSLNLSNTCKECEFLDACGGGHITQRYSKHNNFDNPSVYCESWKQILSHVWQKISPTLQIRSGAVRD